MGFFELSKWAQILKSFIFRVQEEREERRKLRKQLQEQLGMDSEPLDKIAPSLDNPYLGTYDSDPLTTNLFMSNLNPKVFYILFELGFLRTHSPVTVL